MAVFAMGAVACSGSTVAEDPPPGVPGDSEPDTQSQPQQPDLPQPADPVLPSGGNSVELGVIDSGFDSTYSELPVRLPSAFEVAAMELPINLEQVSLMDSYDLTPGQLAGLSSNGFVAVPGSHDEFHELYSRMQMQELPCFITTDALLHVYHLLFDKVLRDLEDELFYPAVAAMTGALEDAAREQFAQAQGTVIEDECRRVWAYFALAEQLILETPPEVAEEVAALVSSDQSKISNHASMTASAILSVGESYIEDFTQYKPRGHYTRSELRKRYFRTMMWYGRMNMRLKSGGETRMALLITRLAHQTQAPDAAVTDLWSTVYDPTAFLVGRSDDLGLREYSTVMRDVYGLAVTLAQLADDELLVAFTAAAKELPPPQINSMLVSDTEDMEAVTHGFRFMGQRFILDGYIFQQLLHDNVTDRFMPSGLDVMAALGNEPAYVILDGRGETAYPHYVERMEKLRTGIGAFGLEDWAQTVYVNWLYMLQGLTEPKDTVFPPFMQTEAWAYKDLHAALGSWAELKHDTILYAKQPYPSFTGMPGYDPVLNWVEPDPQTLARMRALTKLTVDGLAQHELPDHGAVQLLVDLDLMLEHLQGIAEAELAASQLTEEQMGLLMYFADWLEHMVVKAADSEYAGEPGDEPAAIIADVATDPNSGLVLEVGTGDIHDIFVVVPDGGGGLQLARGGIYSYYEFTWPAPDRLTDEQWRAQVADGTQPPPPDWTAEFIVR